MKLLIWLIVTSLYLIDELFAGSCKRAMWSNHISNTDLLLGEWWMKYALPGQEPALKIKCGRLRVERQINGTIHFYSIMKFGNFVVYETEMNKLVPFSTVVPGKQNMNKYVLKKELIGVLGDPVSEYVKFYNTLDQPNVLYTKVLYNDGEVMTTFDCSNEERYNTVSEMDIRYYFIRTPSTQIKVHPLRWLQPEVGDYFFIGRLEEIPYDKETVTSCKKLSFKKNITKELNKV